MRNILRTAMACASILLSIAACGDSGPNDISPRDALQSLSSGIQEVADATAPGAATFAGSLGVLEPLLTRANVSIDGTSQSMYALGLRETFPEGTCFENVFINPAFPPEPGVCTPLTLGAFLVFWQSHSASAPPDRLLVILADQGTTNFSYDLVDPLSDLSALGFAIYAQGQDKIWVSSAGTLTSAVTATGAACSIPIPPYATSATCSFASFDEQGSITFEPEFTGTGNVTISIPRQGIAGIWEQITGVQPITLSALRATTPSLLRQQVPAALLGVPDKFQRSSRR
jgi:predicted small lipoprotein YifL